jgi:branched-chain amino acid transport system permease protein
MASALDYTLLSQLALDGVLLGLVYGLVGLGLSLVLGVMNILSIAHGAVYILGAYFAFSASLQFGIPPLGAIAVGVGGAFAVGLLMDRLISPVVSDGTSVSMITFGFAIIVEEAVLLVWGGIPVAMKPVVSGSVVVGQLYAQSEVLLSAVSAAAVALLTVVFLKRTRTGKSFRMVSQNREAAEMLGVNAKRVSALALALGSAYAGLAGSLLSPVYFVSPDAQWSVLTAAFVIVILGGLGSVAGSMVAGLIYGVLETVGSFLVPAGSDIMVLGLIIAIIVIRPSGLFGSREPS